MRRDRQDMGGNPGSQATPEAPDGSSPSGFDPGRLLELAERCENAAGPDAELDMLIDCALKGVGVVYPTEGHPMTPGRGGRIESAGDYRLLGWIDPGEHQRNFSPYGEPYSPVTASLDAAMTLVPEGWEFEIRRKTVRLWSGRKKAEANNFSGRTALALTTAALKAIATETRRAETTGSVDDEGAGPKDIAQ